MVQGREEFARQLRESFGIEPELLDANRIVFPFEVPRGRFAGTEVRLGFEVPEDFPRRAPPGPHISPRILPINTSANSHPDKVLESPKLGDSWEYWSRPYPSWRGIEAVESYLLGHIVHLFETA